MMGNALDVLIASSFSNKSLLKIKNLTSFLNWYKKNIYYLVLMKLIIFLKKKF